MEKFPFSLCRSLHSSSGGTKAGEAGGMRIGGLTLDRLPNTLSHSVYSHFSTPQVASRQLRLPLWASVCGGYVSTSKAGESHIFM